EIGLYRVVVEQRVVDVEEKDRPGRHAASSPAPLTGPCTASVRAAPRATKKAAALRGPRPLTQLTAGSARAVTARIEAGDHGPAVVGGRARALLRRAGRIEAGLVDRPAVALVAIVLRLLGALAVARIDVDVRRA